jgi:hypothetical protein
MSESATSGSATSSETDLQQSLKVVRGNPSAEELAVVIALLQQAATEEASLGHRVKAQPKSMWHKNQDMLRTPIVPGHLQWQASARWGR